MSFFQSFNTRSTRTFKPKPNAGAQAQFLRQYAESTLGAGSLRQAVKLPEGEDVNEWIAVHVVDFFNQVNMLYGPVTEFCSPAACPRMIATEEYEYLWQDSGSAKYSKPTRLSAPDYIENLMTFTQSYFNNEQYFPSRIGVPFGKGAPAVFKTILRRLFRVYAHIYCHHFDQITELGLQSHLNTSLKHFVLFCREFNLIEPKEFGPLQDLIQIMIEDDSK